jgi:SpoIIAA-like
MIRVLENLPENVLGVEAVGEVTDEDYEQVLVPAVARQREAHGRVRFVYVIGDEFDGWTLGALWDDAKLGTKDIRSWEKIAVVTDKDWLQHAVKAFGWMVPGEVRVVGTDELDAAVQWAAS